MKVIVADDSRLIRGIIEKAVGSIGFQAIQAVNGQEALNLLEANEKDVDLVLLDWNMPIMSGFEVLKMMQRDARFKEIPVIMISTESEDHRINEAIKAGAQSYLTKPFTAERLTETIRVVFEKLKKPAK